MTIIFLILTALTDLASQVSGWSFYEIGRSIEMCNGLFIKPDMKGLKDDLDNNLFGQDIVKDALYAVLSNHFEGEPKKALVISMHGWTGSGKNYVSEMIVNRIYRFGYQSKFVHFFTGRFHFPRSNSMSVINYQRDLQSWLRGNISNCENSLFIFDEIEKIPDGVIDGIKPFLDYNSLIDKINFKKSIFLFLSNHGGDVILDEYLYLRKRGVPRTMMEYRNFESLLRENLYRSEGIFQQSTIIEDHLISLFLPFLPMEKLHVEMCIQAEFKRNGFVPKSNEVDYIIKSLEYFEDVISISGCKRVADHVGLFLYNKNTHYNEL